MKRKHPSDIVVFRIRDGQIYTTSAISLGYYACEGIGWYSTPQAAWAAHETACRVRAQKAEAELEQWKRVAGKAQSMAGADDEAQAHALADAGYWVHLEDGKWQVKPQ